LLKEVISATFF